MECIKIDLNSKTYIKNVAIALGNFDGFHIGHRELINELNRVKKEKKFNTALLLFDIHSKDFIENTNSKRLMSFNDKLEILDKMNIDYVFKINFDDKFKNLLPDEFLDFLTKNINVKHIVVGDDYRFSKDKYGNAEFIYSYMKKKNLTVSILNNVDYNGEKISSTNIISYISLGKIELANKFLGRYYSIKGTVKSGFRRGRTMGFPTANLFLSYNYIVPKEGVYFTKTLYKNKEYFSFTSIGNNPTFQNKNFTIETHIFDFDKDIYDENIEVFFIKKIRDNIKFNSIEELIEKLKDDKKYCKELIKTFSKEE